MSTRAAAICLVLVAAARLVVAGTTGIVEDEAYYWVWSTRLAAGYYDHPPAIAWLIAASAKVLGATSIGVRAAPVLAGVAAAALLLPHARDKGLFVLLSAALPLYTLGGVLATPDVPLLLGWALALRGALDGNWLIAGLGAGLAGLGKYTGWGLWPLFILGAGWRPAMLAGIALTLLVLAPNLVWNALHDWISIRFQFGHGLDSNGNGALTFALAQVGLVSPVLFGAIVAWWSTRWREERLLVATSLPVVVFFTLAASRGAGEANWAAPAWMAAILGLSRTTGRLNRAGWLGGGLAAALSGLVIVHLYAPLATFEGDPTGRLGVGRDLAASVEAWDVEPVYTERYQEAALIRYYASVDAVTMPDVGRMDQFDLWTTPWAERALYVRPWRGGVLKVTEKHCADRGGQNVVTEHNPDGSVLDRWQVYEVFSCHP